MMAARTIPCSAAPGRTARSFQIDAVIQEFGKEAALTAGLDHAKGDAVIMIDADFQHPVEMIPEFLRFWQAGYDMVYGLGQRLFVFYVLLVW